MYLKGTKEYELLEKLSFARKNCALFEVSRMESFGVASNKLCTDQAVIDRLAADGYLTKIPRERWTSLWVTPLGINDYVGSLPPPPVPSANDLRFVELKLKLRDGTITDVEVKELLKLQYFP